MRVGVVVAVLLVALLAPTATAGHDVRPIPPFSTPAGDDRRGAAIAQVTGGSRESGRTVGLASTNMTIRLQANGDAKWIVTTSVALSGPNDTRAFGDLADRYESGRADVGPSVVPFERASEAAEELTEREMAIESVSRTARIENETHRTARMVTIPVAAEPIPNDTAAVNTGQLVLRFTWTTSRVRAASYFGSGTRFVPRAGRGCPGSRPIRCS